ncbi:hypothetical protein POK33_38995 [Burkholderia cenocepacia]|nr:hypothetical protein [Burkholderia cenocepacia]MDF0506742.1 hypothetical protein [Burkholderia cenocepacia]
MLRQIGGAVDFDLVRNGDTCIFRADVGRRVRDPAVIPRLHALPFAD